MAKPRINIGCPWHGALGPPYKTTTIHVGKSDVGNITCALCSSCGAYYTTALAINLGNADPVDGRPVKRGLMISKEMSDSSSVITYDSSPILKHGQASQKKTTPLKPNDRKTDQGVLSQSNAGKQSLQKISSSMSASSKKAFRHHVNEEYRGPSVSEFVVSNRLFGTESGICPVCRSVIYSKQYNVPVYDAHNSFYAYYTAQLFYCRNCNEYVMDEEEFRKLTRKVNAPARKNHVRPLNMQGRYDRISDSYLYSPVADTDMFFRKEKVIGYDSSEGGSVLDNLNSRSFLSELGYSTGIRKEDRQQILQVAVRKYGKRKTADHLRFLITTRQRQLDGVRRYAFAISVWQEDLNYIVKL